MSRISQHTIDQAFQAGTKNDYNAKNILISKFKNSSKAIMKAYLVGYELYQTSLSYVMKIANAKAKVWKSQLGGDLKVYLSIALKEEMLQRKHRLGLV